MGIYPSAFPWLSKPAAVRSVIELIAVTAEAHNASVAYLDYAGASAPSAAPFWLAPTGRTAALQMVSRHDDAERFDAPEDSLLRGLGFLARFKSELSSGTFVFVVSDFLGESVPVSAWLTAAAHRWEVIPVIVQDPVWERSFPRVRSLVLPFVDPDDGATLDVHVTAKEARALGARNEQRHAELVSELTALGIEPVEIGSSEDDAIDHAFIEWAARRRMLRMRR